MRTRIVLVADDPFVRGGMGAVMAAEPTLTVVAEVSGLVEAWHLGVRERPDLFVVDLPVGSPPALDMVHRLNTVSESDVTPVLLLSAADSGQLDLDVLRLGGCAVLRRRSPVAEFLAAVRLVTAGYLPVERKLAERLAHATRRIDVGTLGAATRHGLTPREREVFALIVRGLSNAEIAASLTVASSTVKSHVQDILSKLGLRNRIEAVIYAYQFMAATRRPSQV